MFLNVFLFSAVLTLSVSQECERNSANIAIKSVISQLEDLKWMLQNNVTETHRNDSLSTNHESGRKTKDYGLLYLIPLLVGTKTAGLTAAAFTVIKLFIIQAFFFSKLALLSLTYLVLKKLLQYNSIHVYKAVSSPGSSIGFHDYVPGFQLDTSGSSVDGLHAQDNAHYSTILQAGGSDAHAYNLGAAQDFVGASHQDDTSSGFTPSSEFTGLGAHASPDLQGQFSIASQTKVAIRPANETTSKADDRVFRTHPILSRKRTNYPSGLTHFSGAVRQRLTY